MNNVIPTNTSNFLIQILRNGQLVTGPIASSIIDFKIANQSPIFSEVTLRLLGRKCSIAWSMEIKANDESALDQFATLREDILAGKYIDITIEASLSDGSKLTAAQACALGITANGDREIYRPTIDIECQRWHISHPNRTPHFLAGRILGVPDYSPSNLTIYTDNYGFNQQCMYLKGRYDYYLVKTNLEGWVIVIDVGALKRIDRQILFMDFLILQFSFGCNLAIDEFYEYDIDGKYAGIMIGDYGNAMAVTEANQGDTISRHSESKAWVAAFFELASKRCSERDDLRMYVPMSSFLNSLFMPADTAYLHLQVGLESFAHRLVHCNNLPTVEALSDKAGWKQWAKTNRAEMLKYVNKGLEESIFQKVINAPKYLSRKMVPSVFEHYSLPVIKDMERELDRRDYIVHQLVMAMKDEAERSSSDDFLSIAIVRTMLVALVSKSVGFCGPILGWERHPDGAFALADPSWWPVDEDAHQDEASTGYVAGLEVTKIGEIEIAFRRWKGPLAGYLIIIADKYYLIREHEDGSFSTHSPLLEEHRPPIEAMIGRSVTQD